MRAAFAFPAPRRPVRTRVARAVASLGVTSAAALVEVATWIEPRLGTGDLPLPRPRPSTVTAFHLAMGAGAGMLLAALTGAAVQALLGRAGARP